jgi:hypothetical protein
MKSVREKALEKYIKDAKRISIYVERIRSFVIISKSEARRIIYLERTGDVKPFSFSFRNSGTELFIK